MVCFSFFLFIKPNDTGMKLVRNLKRFTYTKDYIQRFSENYVYEQGRSQDL